jgi:hypothetical protein
MCADRLLTVSAAPKGGVAAERVVSGFTGRLQTQSKVPYSSIKPTRRLWHLFSPPSLEALIQS